MRAPMSYRSDSMIHRLAERRIRAHRLDCEECNHGAKGQQDRYKQFLLDGQRYVCQYWQLELSFRGEYRWWSYPIS
jgi:hypothetical protein